MTTGKWKIMPGHRELFPLQVGEDNTKSLLPMQIINFYRWHSIVYQYYTICRYILLTWVVQGVSNSLGCDKLNFMVLRLAADCNKH